MTRIVCTCFCFSLALFSSDLKAADASSQKAKIFSAGKKALAGDTQGAVEELQNATPSGMAPSLVVPSRRRGIKPFYLILTVFLRDGFPELAQAGGDVLVKTRLPEEFALSLIGAYWVSEDPRVKSEIQRAIDSLKIYFNGVEATQLRYQADMGARKAKETFLNDYFEHITIFYELVQIREDWLSSITHPLGKLALSGYFKCKDLLADLRYRLR